MLFHRTSGHLRNDADDLGGGGGGPVRGAGRPAGSTWTAAACRTSLTYLDPVPGLPTGTVSTVGQVQLVQPVLSIAWAALLLHESLTWPTVIGGIAVLCAAAAAVRTRRTPKET
jgi:hypothetical protein